MKYCDKSVARCNRYVQSDVSWALRELKDSTPQIPHYGRGLLHDRVVAMNVSRHYFFFPFVLSSTSIHLELTPLFSSALITASF